MSAVVSGVLATALIVALFINQRQSDLIRTSQSQVARVLRSFDELRKANSRNEQTILTLQGQVERSLHAFDQMSEANSQNEKTIAELMALLEQRVSLQGGKAKP